MFLFTKRAAGFLVKAASNVVSLTVDSVIPGRLEEANPESRDSQVRNCAP